MQEKNRVWLSIGSNQQRARNIRGAIEALRFKFGELVLSPVYQSPAVGFTGADFYNLVVGLYTDLAIPALVTVLRDIEEQQGRVRSDIRFGPRTLDIDVLTYGDQVFSSDEIEIPRDEILKYAFVLGPLAEVAPDEKHPLTRQRYADIWQAFPDRQKASLQLVTLD